MTYLKKPCRHPSGIINKLIIINPSDNNKTMRTIDRESETPNLRPM